MKNKFLISFITAGLLLSVNANAKTKQQEIKELKAKIADLEEAIEDLEERTDTIETRSYTDKIQFRLGMRVEANNVDTTYADGTNPANEDVIYRTKLNLNMKAKIAPNLKFSGRLSSYKNWGDSNTNQQLMAEMDARQGRTPDNHSDIYLERAYLDWYMTQGSVPLTLTLGRQPSSDGPSFEIKEGFERKGTYDALAFDGAADGVVLTANLSKVTPGGTAFRVAYGKPNNASDYNSSLEDTRVTGFFIDKTCQFIKAKHLIQAYVVRAKDLDANPNLVDSNNGSNLDKNIGDVDLYGVMLQVEDVNHLDFFIHYAHSTAKPNGNDVNLTQMGMGATEGLLTSTAGDTTEKNGHAYWAGIRYNFKDWAFGYEYNQGSQNWFSFTYAPNYPLNKLAARGDASEFYITKKINKFANIRVGYIDINYDYTGSGSHLSAPMAITNALGTSAVKEVENTYITFNVLF